ncbi:MAG: AAA family ATPase, partial [Eubacterium sp.]|nr:AAA family ATPase [Eubacterium sp.]
MKKLTKIRLINWHRFSNETIEVGDSVLLSGENGAGKSTILDALQYVLTCSKANFNKAAHEKGKRTLNTYIRCKTGREDRPYERTGSITGHIALEFLDEERKAPFIVGVVMDSATEEKEPNSLWYLIERKGLKDDLFFQGKKVKSISMFRSSNRGVRTFAATKKEAQRMMLARFGRLEDKFFTLIPKALAFRPIHDIKDFVYSYVLDAKEVNIDSLRENVRSYQDLERMLVDVRNRIRELEAIIESQRAVETFSRREKHQDYYIALTDQDLTGIQIRDNLKNTKSREREQQEAEKAQTELQTEIRAKEQTIRDLDLELNMDEEYQAFRELERQESRLTEALKQDRKEMKKLKAAAAAAFKDGERILKVPEADPVVEEYCGQLKGLEKVDDLAAFQDLLDTVIDYKKRMLQKILDRLAEIKLELRKDQEEKAGLQSQIRELEAKRMIYPEEVIRLKRTIVTQFNRLGREADVRILSELLEVNDPSWHNAVEGYLNTQRFYLIVPPEDFDLALSVYENQRKKKKAYGVGLINTGKLDEYDKAPEGSLAAYVSSGNIWARRYINMVLGKVRCVESVKELKQYPVSITKGCMRYQNHVVSAIRPAIYRTPYIGANAIRIQLEQKKRELSDLNVLMQERQARRKAMEQVEASLDSHKDLEVKFQLRTLEDLRFHEKSLKKCKEDMSKIKASQTLIEKRIRLEEMKREKEKLDARDKQLSEKIGGCRSLIHSLKDQLRLLNLEMEEKKQAADQVGQLLGGDQQYCQDNYEK